MSPIAEGAIKAAPSPDIVNAPAPGPGATPVSGGAIPGPGTTPDPSMGFGKSGAMPAPVANVPDQGGAQPQTPTTAPTAPAGGAFGKGGMPAVAPIAQPTQNPMIQKPSFQSQLYPTLPGYNLGNTTQANMGNTSRATQNPLLRKPAFQRGPRGRIV